MISYIVIIPFWSMAGTSFQVTIIEVGEIDMADTLAGGLAGTVKHEYYSQHNVKKKSNGT